MLTSGCTRCLRRIKMYLNISRRIIFTVHLSQTDTQGVRLFNGQVSTSCHIHNLQCDIQITYLLKLRRIILTTGCSICLLMLECYVIKNKNIPVSWCVFDS